MPRFTIRACEQQTLYDGREHPIEAETPEQAAAILRDMIRGIDDGVRPWPEDADGERICRPDPREIIDGESFFELLDENGDWDRDVDPDADGEAPADLGEVRAEWMEECISGEGRAADCADLLLCQAIDQSRALGRSWPLPSIDPASVLPLLDERDRLRAALECAQTYLGDDATDDSDEARATRAVIRAALSLS